MLGFDVCELVAPYTPERYIGLIHEAEKAGYDTIILDSLTHEWSGVGGLLEDHGKMPGNSWANWRTITPRHQALIDTMLQSRCHIIATMRTKAQYIQSTDGNNKAKVEKVGTEPQQRDGMDYEFTVVFDLAENHMAKCSKDRTTLYDGMCDKLTEGHGERLKTWLSSGAPAKPTPNPTPAPAQPQVEATGEREKALAAIRSVWEKRGAYEEGFPSGLRCRNSIVGQMQGNSLETIEITMVVPDEWVARWFEVASMEDLRTYAAHNLSQYRAAKEGMEGTS